MPARIEYPLWDKIEDSVTGVYGIYNISNDKCYVGSSSESIRGRWVDHRDSLLSGTHGNQHLQRAWDKYGESYFLFKIIEECEPIKCVEREQFWIDGLEVTNPDKGYNISPTAGSQLGYRHTDETRQKIKKANTRRTQESFDRQAEKLRGRAQDPEVVARRAESIKRAWQARKANGYTVSAETRAKISLASKGKKKSERGRANIQAGLVKRYQESEGHSEETRKKMSESAKRRGISPEQRKKLIEARKRKLGY